MPGPRRSDRRRGNGGMPAPGKEQPSASVTERRDARAERTAVFGKTKLCKFYILGVCAKGKDCAFAHDPSEMNAMPDLSRTKICKTLINTGACDDPNCTYAHNKEELRTAPPALPDSRGRSGTDNSDVIAGQKANTSFPGAGGGAPTPFMPGMPPGQGMDQANAAAFQQWMSNMAMHMSHMMVQNQAQMRGGQGPGAQPQQGGAGQGQSFLYNALFTGDLDQQTDIPLPSMANNNMQQQDARVPSGSPNFKKNRNLNKALQPAAAENKAFAPCCSCGVEYYPEDANFCRSCGQRRLDAMAPSSEVPYKVKNTFIDVQAGQSPVGGLRNVKSAAGRLNHLAGLNSPQQMQDDASLGFPVLPLSEQDVSSLAAMGTSPNGVGGGLGFDQHLPIMHRNNITWASDLDALAEETREDLDATPGNNDQDLAPSGVNSSEKRLQDTPFLSDAASAEPENSGDEARTSSMGNPEESAEDALAIDKFVVKNTFIEFAQRKPLGGMRMVQTAAGRLDMMDQGQE